MVRGLGSRDRSNEPDPRDQRHCPKISAEERGYDNRFFDQAQRSDNNASNADNTPATAVYETNDAWKPLATLVKQLPSLTDLIYGMSQPVSTLSA